MKTLTNGYLIRSGCALISASLLLLTNLPRALADDSGTGVAPPGSHPFGKTYSQWAGRWWKWFMQLDLTNSAGFVHPGLACGTPFDIREGQIGEVWFLAAPLGPACSRSATIPQGKALFFGLLNAEQSSLESNPSCGDDATCQGQAASSFADLIENLSCEIDTVPVPGLAACSPPPCSYRVVNPQIHFTAPPCWIFSTCANNGNATMGGPATSVGDGYYIFLNPLSPGVHTIHFKGDFAGLGASLDMTYQITVQAQDDDGD